MTRIKFGVSALSFAANMAVKQNAIDFSQEYPLTAKTVHTSIYVDDCLTDASTATEALSLLVNLSIVVVSSSGSGILMTLLFCIVFQRSLDILEMVK